MNKQLLVDVRPFQISRKQIDEKVNVISSEEISLNNCERVRGLFCQSF